MSGWPRSDLEQIGDRLEQVEAILAYEGPLHRRLIAVRSLLNLSGSAVLPTRSMRKRWTDMLETMLRLDAKVAAPAEAAELLRQVESLRRAVRAHEVDIGS
jgi:hypothetical protein